MPANVRGHLRHALPIVCGLTGLGSWDQPGCFRSDDPELRHQCALPTPSRIRRHIFTIGLWQLPEHGAERRASSAGPVVLDPGVRARALRPHRQLRRVGLLLDPAELRGRGTGCANSFWPTSGRRYCEVLSSDVGGRPGNAVQHSLRMPAGPRESDANGDLHQQVARALTAGANRAADGRLAAGSTASSPPPARTQIWPAMDPVYGTS